MSDLGVEKAEADRTAAAARQAKRALVDAALVRACGNLRQAAALLAWPVATLDKAVTRYGLRERAAELRGGTRQGRPRSVPTVDRDALAKAWRESGRNLRATTITVGLPLTARSSVRALLHRYGIPDPPMRHGKGRRASGVPGRRLPDM